MKPLRRKITTSLLAQISMVVFAVSTASAGFDYYIAPGGDDLADGLAPGTAWATLQHAADTIAPGDTVFVADGNYVGMDLRIVASELDPVAFIAQGDAAAITADNPVTPDGINIENAAYVTIDGFVVNGRTRAGIRVVVSEHITIRGCSAGANGVWGIFTGFADDMLIEDNETWGSIDEHGIYVSNSGDRPVIRGNDTHDNYAIGIHMNGDASVGGDGIISDALVEQNIIHGNGRGGGSGINMDGVQNSIVRNNLVYDHHSSGISLFHIDGAEGSKNNLVINNTFWNASDGRWCVNINSDSTGNRILNNILLNDHAFRGAISVDASSIDGLIADHNSLIDRLSIDGGDSVIDLAAWQALGFGANSFLASASDHFVNAGVDFSLLPSSPAIDAGTATGAPGNDLLGAPRPVGSGVDVGPLELQLLECGDGDSDSGEECGEPTLPACSDPCTECSGCTCAPAALVCGDALLCPGEQCETDTDCDAMEVCSACGCELAPLCNSGISLERAKLSARPDPARIKIKAEAVLPLPWMAIDPPTAGITARIDGPSGGETIDIVLDAGSWTAAASGTHWKYQGPSGLGGASTAKAKLRDASKKEPGRLKLTIKIKDGQTLLPAVEDIRTSVVFGSADECASLSFGGPDDDAPRCRGDATKIRCK